MTKKTKDQLKINNNNNNNEQITMVINLNVGFSRYLSNPQKGMKIKSLLLNRFLLISNW